MLKKLKKKKEEFAALDWQRLWNYPKPHIKAIAAAGVLLVFASSFSLLMPLLTGEMVSILSGLSQYTLLQLTAFMGCVIVVQSAASLVGSYKIAKIDATILARIRQDTYSHLSGLPFAFFTDKRTGELVSRMNYDIMGINSVTTSSMISSVQNIIRLIGGFCGMLYISPYLTCISLAISPFFVLISVYFGKKYFKLARISQTLMARISGAISEASVNIRIIKSFTRESHERQRFKRSVDASYTNSMRSAWLGSLYKPLMSFVVYSGTLLVFWFGGRAASDGGLETSELVSFLMFMGMFAGSVRSFSGMYQGIMTSMGSLKKVFEMLALDTENIEPEDKNTHCLKGNIKCVDISFRYSEEFQPVFEKMNLEIKSGETLALIGPSGVGKSTLLNLFPVFYQIDAGRIFFDGVSIDDINLSTLRSQIGIVPQDLQLFNGSVVDNLRFGRLDATQEEIVEACKSANADDFITALPNGYKTPVGESGVKLSYGQRQRIAIARVILKDPAILLLDEPTSALDLESELIVQDALKKLMAGRTTLIAGHHLNTFKFADRIAVIGNQGIAEIGSHEELMALDGYYARVRRKMEGIE